MSNDATGPRSAVRGAKSTAIGGTVFTQARSTPLGAQTSWVYSGFEPCSIAWSHQPNDQIGIWGSSNTPMYWRPGSSSGPRPQKRNARPE